MQDAAPFALVVRFTVRSDAEAAFDQLTAHTAARVRAEEPDTLIYACHRVDGAPRERIFYELYRDRAAFDEHESREYVRQFLEAREPMLEDTRVDVLSLQDGKTPAAGEVRRGG